jgi:hypothetical protein
MDVCALTRNRFSYWGLVKPAVHVQGIFCLSAQQLAYRGITSMQLVYLMTLSITEGYVESDDRISSEWYIGTYAKMMWPNYNPIAAEENHKQNRQCKIKARSRNHFCHGKAISVIYSECACLWRMKCMWLMVICGQCLPYFSTLSRKLHDFRKNVIDHKVCTYFNFFYHFRLKHLSF